LTCATALQSPSDTHRIMSTMKVVLLLVAAFVFVHAEEAKQQDEQVADPSTVYYSKQVVYSKPVVTHYTTSHVVHGGSSVVHGATSATADFRQEKLPGIRAHGVQGHMLNNGNFIFYWINGPYRKMVLTTNSGKQIKSGYVMKGDSFWKDVSKWKPYGYSISNFKAIMKAAAPACTVDLFQHSNYKGVKTTYTKSGGIKWKQNDQMSSLKVGNGCCVILYEHYGYKGKSRKVCQNTSWIGSGWNDIVSSIKIVRGDEEEEELDEENVEEEDEDEDEEQHEEQDEEEEEEDEEEPEEE